MKQFKILTENLGCDRPLPYVCKLEKPDALPDWSEDDPRGEIIPCDAPWETYGHHCYLPMKDKGTQSWATAEYMCRNLGQSKRFKTSGHLIRIPKKISHPFKIIMAI